MSEQTGTIYAVRNDRLGGRLGAMLNAKRIADDYGARFRFTWASHDNVSPELQNPEMLFSEGFLARHHEHERGYGDLQSNVQSVEKFIPPIEQNEFETQLAEGKDFRCNEPMRAISLPWENDEHIAQRVTETLETIEFTERVVDCMKMIRSKLGTSNLVAYHLRRGDIIDPETRASNVLWPNKYIPRVFYETHISRVLSEDPNARIVVFSDTEHELSAFVNMSERVIAASSLLADDNLHVLQRDFMELYIMSRCRRIIGPGASAFSAVAAMLGNSQVVDIREDLSSQEHTAALIELTHRLDNRPELFAGSPDLGQNFPELIAFHREQGSEDITRRILQKHMDAGFSQSYIYDLLAEEYFWGKDVNGALNLIETLQNRPILTDLGNSASYIWSGLAALSARRITEASRLAHVGHWLQPILPISRLLMSALIVSGSLSRDNQYPVPQQIMLRKAALTTKFTNIAKCISPELTMPDSRGADSAYLYFIPFELEVRDWARLQTIRLPSPFWNIPNQRKMIRFFCSTYQNHLNDPAVMSLLGQLYSQAGEIDQGAHLIKQAYQIDSKDAFVTLRLARLMLQQNNNIEAQTLYDQAVEASDGQICFRAEQGLAKLEFGDKEGAIKIFCDLAEIDHEMIELLILTADVLRRKGKYREEALRIAFKANQLVPGGARSGQILRKILEQLGRNDEAEAIRTKLLAWKRNPGKFSSRAVKKQASN